MADPVAQRIPPAQGSVEQLFVDPMLLTGYLLTVLEWKFGAVSSLSDPAFRKDSYLWKPTDTEVELVRSRVLIESVTNWNPRQSLQRPAILVARNDVSQGGRLSMGDRHHGSAMLIGTVDANREPTLGFDKQVVQVVGSHSIFVIAATGAASETLALDVWHTMLDYQGVIRTDLGLQEFRVEALQKTGKLVEFRENWVTPMAITWKYQRATILRMQSPILKAFSLAGGDAGDVQGDLLR